MKTEQTVNLGLEVKKKTKKDLPRFLFSNSRKEIAQNIQIHMVNIGHGTYYLMK